MDWNSRYVAGDLPWDTGQPDVHLVNLVESGRLRPGRVLEVGCGTGTNALYLARQGFDVLGVDVSEKAIGLAQAKLGATQLPCRFVTLDFLSQNVSGAPFDLVFDRGCFHSFDAAEARSRFASHVARVLAPRGMWVSVIGSTEGPARDVGPPRRSARDIAAAVEPSLEIMELRGVSFRDNLPDAVRAWLCVAQKREVPAVASTQRG